ncbi:MAG: pyrimidine 5'-nucleotidase [Desulfuromonadales bacterium]|nr:pyrimidine 5'-nucleotidase [Desulfuromonadales bacterium]
MDVLIFDLDNTLYPPERQLFSLIDVRINRYMTEVVGIPAAEVDGLRRDYWRQYGVTLQGLIRHHAVDPEDYLYYVHDVDVGTRLSADPQLRAALEALPQRKTVFTNGSTDHALRVLAALGVHDLFDSIYDIRVADYRPKPFVEPYQAVLAALDIAADRCVMIEDMRDNLRTAKELGMRTVLVGDGATPTYVDLHLADVCQVSDGLLAWSAAG